jgi:thioredoxin 2
MPLQDTSVEGRLHVVCPHCATTNRVPSTRLADGATCGSCKRHLLEGKPFALDAAGFDRQIAHSDLPVVVDFWAPWCGPCRSMAPAYEQAAARLAPGVRLAKVDTEAHADLAARFDIRSIPTLVVFRGGREVARRSGALPLAELVRWIEANTRA